MPVDRCICRDISFSDLKALAAQTGADFKELRTATNCATACSLCGPYIRKMLATGETDQPLMAPAELTRWIDQSEPCCTSKPMPIMRAKR
ncbi:hypothetical protein PHYC_01518 [Phycisphaerales bacterium]|nr:hypothetical protein PHYC_01518 [Phycisphaerales bacterium]